jgi:hypothetical protein
MRTALWLVPLLLLAPLSTTAAADDAIDLDVTRIALFSSGVGYFECDTTVTGTATAELDFRTNQINDILKSMIVLDYDGGTAGIVRYPARDPIERTLASFAVDLTDRPTLGQLLDQLRGEPVVITGMQRASGLIVGVEQTTLYSPDQETLEVVDQITILTDSGLQRVRLDKIEGIQLQNEKIAAELRKALATLAQGHDADKKTVTVQFDGSGARRVRVAYLLEAPIWKTSYRLVMNEESSPLLQGWATVENTTADDWQDVRLSLVSGRPISFRMDLYTPLYVPRPFETFELYAALRPPEYAAGFDVEEDGADEVARGTVARRLRGRAGRELKLDAAMPAAPARGGGAGGEGVMLGEEAWFGISGDALGVQAALGEETGELFSYHIDRPVTIPRQQSAMLPIVAAEVEATKLSIFNPATHPRHPLNGLEMKNTSGLNLMQGPVTVFDGGTYAGDAKLPDLAPNETRLVAYALDLSTDVLIEQRPHPRTLVGVKIVDGVLWTQRKRVDRRVYVIKNNDDDPRTVMLEQPFGGDWDLVEPKEAYERSHGLLRFKVAVGAESTERHPVELERIDQERFDLTSMDIEDIHVYIQSERISAAVKDALERVIALRNEYSEARQHRLRLDGQKRDEVAEQERIRENLKTLDRNSDAYRRQLQHFDEVDNRILTLNAQIKEAQQVEDQQRAKLAAYVAGLNIE